MVNINIGDYVYDKRSGRFGTVSQEILSAAIDGKKFYLDLIEITIDKRDGVGIIFRPQSELIVLSDNSEHSRFAVRFKYA